jgi:hypothetical protein
MNFNRVTLENACDGSTRTSPRIGLNMSDIKLYLRQENVHVPKGINRYNIQGILCTHLKTLSTTVANIDTSEIGEDERDISGMTDIDNVLHILRYSIRNEDFDEPIQWRHETLQRYYGLYDFERRMKDKTEPEYKDNIDNLKKDIGDLERLRVLRKILLSKTS